MNKKFNSIRYSQPFDVLPNDARRIKEISRLVGRQQRVLDVGCGDGFLSRILASNDNQVFGIEISEWAVQAARKHGISVIETDLNDDWSWAVGEERFDVVVIGEVLEHIFDTDRFLENVRTVLKERGRLVISTPNIATLGRRLLLLLGMNPLIETTARSYDAGHIRYFTIDTLRALLDDHHFKITSTRSDCVSFDRGGRIRSELLAHWFPRLGRSIIVEAHTTATSPQLPSTPPPGTVLE